MVKKYVVIWSLCLSALGLWTPAFAVESVALSQRPTLADTWAYALDGAGKGWFAYYGDKENTLYARRPDGSEVALGANDRERYQSGVAIAPTGQDVTVLWRDKLPEKTLYFLPGLGPSGSTPQPLVAGGQESEPLARMQAAHRDGVTYLLWMGEKGNQENQGTQGKDTPPKATKSREDYHLYFRYTEDDGKNFSTVERVLSGLYPTWILDKQLIPIFSRTLFDGQPAMMMRVFDRVSKKLGLPVKVADAPPAIEPILEAFESGGRWFLLWIGLYGDKPDRLLEGVVSDDKGQTWKRFSFESLRGLDISRLDTANDGQGHILISVSGSWRFREGGDSKAKHDVYVIRSADYGTTWTEPQQPRAADLRQFQALYPSAVFGPQPGSVMLVWEDWRNIRPTVYVQFSKDYGVSWSEATPLDRLSIGLGLDYRNKAAWKVGNRYQVLAKRYLDSTFKPFDIIRYEFNAAELQQQPTASAKQPGLTEPSSEAHLRERVATYWKAMKEQDWTTTYAINDPFFRAKLKFDAYRSARGPIKHLGYELLDITRQGNLAKVRVRFDAEVPEFVIQGKTYSKPKDSFETVDTWLFVDGDWYREYYDQVQDIRFTRY